MLRAGALGRPRGIGWGGRQEGGLGWETHVNPWLIHVNVWQKPLQYCKVISLQIININGKKLCMYIYMFICKINLQEYFELPKLKSRNTNFLNQTIVGLPINAIS